MSREHSQRFAILRMSGAVGKVLLELTYMFQFSIALRKDLEVARTLAELARKQELQKLKQVQIIHEIISNLVFHTQGNCVPFLR